MDVYLSDSTVAGSSTIGVTLGQFSSNNMNGISLANDNLQTAANAQAALTDINNAISQVAALRGNIGASVNRLQAASNVVNNQIQNLTSAQSDITAADIPTEVANLTKYSILNQTGISALAQANQMQQACSNCSSSGTILLTARNRPLGTLRVARGRRWDLRVPLLPCKFAGTGRAGHGARKSHGKEPCLDREYLKRQSLQHSLQRQQCLQRQDQRNRCRSPPWLS